MGRGAGRARITARLPASTAAACVGTDPDLWFRRDGEAEAGWVYRAEHAKAICARCPIRDACLSWALTTDQEHGVWGGLTEAERDAKRRRDRRRDRRAAS